VSLHSPISHRITVTDHPDHHQYPPEETVFPPEETARQPRQTARQPHPGLIRSHL